MANSRRDNNGRFISKNKAVKKEYLKEDTINAITRANLNLTQANIGDSYESRPLGLSPYLGGGYDNFPHGSFNSWPAQSDSLINVGLDGDPRYTSISNSQSLVNATKMAWCRIKMCRDVYDNDGQVSSIVDLMADFATDGVRIIHKNKSVQNFYEAWAQQINITDRIRRAIIDILLAGTTFYYRVYAKLDNSDINTMKNFVSAIKIDNALVIKTKSDESIVEPTIIYNSTLPLLFDDVKDDEVPNKIKDLVVDIIKTNAGIIEDESIKTKKNRIPWKYISLNPLQMIPNGDGTWSYLLTKEDVGAILKKLNLSFDSTTKTINIKLPNGLDGKLQKISDKTNKSGFYAEIKLSNDVLIPIQYNKFDWSQWSVPTVWKVLPTVIFKNTLRAMEMKTARAGINTVTLWKLGDHEKGLLPQADEFERLADMLKAPAATLNILWSSAISAEVIQPDLKQIYDVNRWTELRKEVTSQFGITQSVVTGEGGNFSSSFISVQGLLERLSTLRELLISSWLYKEIKIIADAMGFRTLPKIMFGQMSLRDEAAEKTFIMNLADRGFISDETLMEYLKRDVSIERERIKRQNEYDKANDITRRGPFIVQDGTAELEEQKAKTQIKLAEMRPKQTNPNGRPPGSKGIPLKKKRPVKPKNLANLELEKFINSIAGNGDDRINKIGWSLAESLYTDKLEECNEFKEDHLAFFATLAQKISSKKESQSAISDIELNQLLIDSFVELNNGR